VVVALVVVFKLVTDTVDVESAFNVTVFVFVGATVIVVLLDRVEALGVEYAVTVLVLPSLLVTVAGAGVTVEIEEMMVVALTVRVFPATYIACQYIWPEAKHTDVRSELRDWKALWNEQTYRDRREYGSRFLCSLCHRGWVGNYGETVILSNHDDGSRRHVS